MFDLGTIGAAIVLENGQFNSALRQTENATRQSTSQILHFFNVAFGLQGAKTLIEQSVDAMFGMEVELANIASIADVSKDKLNKSLMAMSNALGKPAENAAAMYYAFSSGMKGSEDQMIQFTGTIAALAKATVTDQTSTMDAITTLMNSYRMSVDQAGEASDFFFQVIKQGKGTGPELANSLGMVTNSAALGGVALNELGAAISVLSRTMPTALAITSLNQVINGFIMPSKMAKDAAAALNIELSAQALQSKGFAAAIEEVTQKAGDNADALGAMFGDIRSFRGVAALAGTQAQEFRDSIVEFGNKGGSAMNAFAVQTDSAKARWDEAMVSMNKSLIHLGQALTPVVESLTKFINATGEMFQGSSGATVLFDIFAAGAGLLMLKLRQTGTVAAAAGAQIAAGMGSAAMTTAAYNARLYETQAAVERVMVAEEARAVRLIQSQTTVIGLLNARFALANREATFYASSFGNQARQISQMQNLTTATMGANRALGNVFSHRASLANFTAGIGNLASRSLSIPGTWNAIGGAMGALNLALFAPMVWDIGYAFGEWLGKLPGISSALESVGDAAFYFVNKTQNEQSKLLDQNAMAQNLTIVQKWRGKMAEAGASKSDIANMSSAINALMAGNSEAFKQAQKIYNGFNAMKEKATAKTTGGLPLLDADMLAKGAQERADAAVKAEKDSQETMMDLKTKFNIAVATGVLDNEEKRIQMQIGLKQTELQNMMDLMNKYNESMNMAIKSGDEVQVEMFNKKMSDLAESAASAKDDIKSMYKQVMELKPEIDTGEKIRRLKAAMLNLSDSGDDQRRKAYMSEEISKLNVQRVQEDNRKAFETLYKDETKQTPQGKQAEADKTASELLKTGLEHKKISSDISNWMKNMNSTLSNIFDKMKIDITLEPATVPAGG